MTAFPQERFDHIIFVHDNSDWSNHSGFEKFIWIRANGQMKFWFIKRFIPMHILKSYRYIWLFDDDAALTFDPLHYECVVSKLNISLSAPGRLNGIIAHPSTRVNANYTTKIGRWVDFVEIGPVVMGSSLAWQCIWDILVVTVSTGFGLDLIWCNLLSETCIPREWNKKACAILDAFIVNHQAAHHSPSHIGEAELHVYNKYVKDFQTKHQIFGALAENLEILYSCNMTK
ncbi:unnamed protein product [Didymodactylos carnosus]|nr:unnamed protein product [Didymodactylos carnosus]CAF4315555.1 unnamed protein product [Didymodactylos carnosus]